MILVIIFRWGPINQQTSAWRVPSAGTIITGGFSSNFSGSQALNPISSIFGHIPGLKTVWRPGKRCFPLHVQGQVLEMMDGWEQLQPFSGPARRVPEESACLFLGHGCHKIRRAQRTKDLNSLVNLRTNSEDRFMVSLSAGDHSRLETCPGHGGFKRFK